MPAEQQASATPTTTVPGDIPAFPGTTPPGGTDPTTGGAAGGGTSTISVTGTVGPPVSLWDVNWPESGYYWTVIPVVGTGASSTTFSAGAVKGATVISVVNTAGFKTGDNVTLGTDPTSEPDTITSVGAGTLTLRTATTIAHPVGDAITHSSGSISYTDAELAQDACAAGRVQRLGISSAPAVTSATTPYATGLSSTGRLTSAANTSKFYGSPLVAWTPAYDASIYEIQYSKTLYPFKPELDPRSSAKGYLTFSTSDILPLSAGTWWYRVRGIDYNLPTGVQQMSWSDPQRLVVAPPKFKLAPVAVKKRKFKVLP